MIQNVYAPAYPSNLQTEFVNVYRPNTLTRQMSLATALRRPVYVQYIPLNPLPGSTLVMVSNAPTALPGKRSTPIRNPTGDRGDVL